MLENNRKRPEKHTEPTTSKAKLKANRSLEKQRKPSAVSLEPEHRDTGLKVGFGPFGSPLSLTTYHVSLYLSLSLTLSLPLSLSEPLKPYMGSCQNYGPFWGTLNNRCRIIIRTQKGTIILTTTHLKPRTHKASGSV